MNDAWIAADGRLDRGHPYRWRTWLRPRLPKWLVELGVARKGRDCEAMNAWHRWYNRDDANSACYHCQIVEPGRHWEVPVDTELVPSGAGFVTPGEAALESFPKAAHARVLWVESVEDAFVLVHVDTDPSHPMRVFCRRFGDRWYEMGDSVE